MQEAASLVDAMVARAPNDADAWHLGGLVASRLGDHRRAVAAFRQAIALRPHDAPAWLALANALARCGESDDAANAYREVLAREPGWPDAHFNLGIVHRRRGNRVEAARSLHAAWSRDPMFFDAAKACVGAIADCVRNGEAFGPPSPTPGGGAATTFTIVVCSIDDARQRNVASLYRRVFAGVSHEIVCIRNPPSLAAAYNDAVARSCADVVLLSHDDVDVLAGDFAARLSLLLGDLDVIGVVGSTRMRGPAIGWSGHPDLRGWITHRAPDELGFGVDVLSPGPLATDIDVLDGVLLAARRHVLTAVPFDAVTFDGFHLYDLDWSYRASRAGFRLGVCGELLLVHASRGRYGAEWQRYADRFCAKHDAGQTPPAPSSFFGTTLDNAEQVRSFYWMLAALAREGAPGAAA